MAGSPAYSMQSWCSPMEVWTTSRGPLWRRFLVFSFFFSILCVIIPWTKHCKLYILYDRHVLLLVSMQSVRWEALPPDGLIGKTRTLAHQVSRQKQIEKHPPSTTYWRRVGRAVSPSACGGLAAAAPPLPAVESSGVPAYHCLALLHERQPVSLTLSHVPPLRDRACLRLTVF